LPCYRYRVLPSAVTFTFVTLFGLLFGLLFVVVVYRLPLLRALFVCSVLCSRCAFRVRLLRCVTFPRLSVVAFGFVVCWRVHRSSPSRVSLPGRFAALRLRRSAFVFVHFVLRCGRLRCVRCLTIVALLLFGVRYRCFLTVTLRCCSLFVLVSVLFALFALFVVAYVCSFYLPLLLLIVVCSFAFHSAFSRALLIGWCVPFAFVFTVCVHCCCSRFYGAFDSLLIARFVVYPLLLRCLWSRCYRCCLLCCVVVVVALTLNLCCSAFAVTLLLRCFVFIRCLFFVVLFCCWLLLVVFIYGCVAVAVTIDCLRLLFDR